MPRFRIQIRLRERQRVLLLFLLGVLGGALFIWQLGTGMEGEIRSEGGIFFARLAQWKEDEQPFLQTVLWRRLVLPILWIVLSFTAVGGAALAGFWVYMGFAVTLVLWSTVAYGGWRGPLYFWGLLFPQYLAYVPALFLLYIGCRRFQEYRRLRMLTVRSTVGGEALRLYAFRLLVGMTLYLGGIWLESHVNPWIFKAIFIKS